MPSPAFPAKWAHLPEGLEAFTFTTRKGFHFAGQTTPSSAPSLSPRPTADWAAPAISDTAAAVDKGLTLPPSRNHHPQRSWSTAGRGKGRTEGQPSRIRPRRGAWEPEWREPKNRPTGRAGSSLSGWPSLRTPVQNPHRPHTSPTGRLKWPSVGSPNSLPQGFNKRLPRSAGAKQKRKERRHEGEEKTVSGCLMAAQLKKKQKPRIKHLKTRGLHGV